MIYKIKENITYEQLEALGYIKKEIIDSEYADKCVNDKCIMVMPNQEILGYLESSHTYYSSIIKLTDCDIENSIKDLIDAKYVEIIKHKCVECHCIDSEMYDFYMIDDEELCEYCLLEKLENEGIIETSIVKNYFIDGEYMADNEEDIIDILIDNAMIRKV